MADRKCQRVGVSGSHTPTRSTGRELNWRYGLGGLTAGGPAFGLDAFQHGAPGLDHGPAQRRRQALDLPHQRDQLRRPGGAGAGVMWPAMRNTSSNGTPKKVASPLQISRPGCVPRRWPRWRPGADRPAERLRPRKGCASRRLGSTSQPAGWRLGHRRDSLFRCPRARLGYPERPRRDLTPANKSCRMRTLVLINAAILSEGAGWQRCRPSSDRKRCVSALSAARPRPNRSLRRAQYQTGGHRPACRSDGFFYGITVWKNKRVHFN